MHDSFLGVMTTTPSPISGESWACPFDKLRAGSALAEGIRENPLTSVLSPWGEDVFH